MFCISASAQKAAEKPKTTEPEPVMVAPKELKAVVQKPVVPGGEFKSAATTNAIVTVTEYVEPKATMPDRPVFQASVPVKQEKDQ